MKRCRDVLGRAAARAFLRCRMEFAAPSLRQSEIPIKEISHGLGFQNQYHFPRVFRRYWDPSVQPSGRAEIDIF
jgi:AraC-like DNA-binding protein